MRVRVRVRVRARVRFSVRARVRVTVRVKMGRSDWAGGVARMAPTGIPQPPMCADNALIYLEELTASPSPIRV